MHSPSFFLELFLHSSPVAILGTYWPGEFIFQCPIFLPFHTVHGVLKARILKWFAIPFSSGPCLAELSTMTCPSWVALHSVAHSFIESDNAVVHVISLVSFLWFWFSFYLPSDGWGLDACRNFLMGETDRGNLGLVLTGGARLSKF